MIIRYLPFIDSEQIPWFILYVYKKGDFVFATSPFLIIIGLVLSYFFISK